jgi:hypothetical protein
VVATLASALALAGVGADAVTFVSSVGRSRHGRTRQEKGRGGGSDSSTRLRSNFHDIPPKDVGNDAPAVDRDENFPTYRLASSDSYVARSILVTQQTKVYFIHFSFDAIDVSDLKSDFITISRCPSDGNDLVEARMRVSLRIKRKFASCDPVDLLHRSSHPELTTDEWRFGYSGFKRKLSFFSLDGGSLLHSGTILAFVAPDPRNDVTESVTFQTCRASAQSPAALHNEFSWIDDVSSVTSVIH